jgi:TRAP-type C4-dicarboxylate transport system substrate-binding protein
MRAGLLYVVGVVGLVTCWAPAGNAEEEVLVFATQVAPGSPQNTQINHPWAQRVNEQGKGVIRIEVRDGPTIANATNAFTRVMDDVIQLSPISLGYVSGRFPLGDVVNLPLISDKGKAASIAFWRLYKSGLLEEEFKDVVPLQVVAYPQAGLHMKGAPPSLNDLRGLKIQAGGKVLSNTVSRLGATPISLSVVELYEALQRGTVDGTAIHYMTFPTFKFDEVTSYHIDFPLSSWPIILAMSRKRYDALSPAARKVLEDNGGERQSAIWGDFYDQLDQSSRAAVEAKKGRHTIVVPSKEVADAWKAKISPVLDDWAKSVKGGEEVLRAYRAEIEKATNELR